MNKKRIYLYEFIVLFDALVAGQKKNNEPLPEMSKSNLDKVDSCLKTPFMTFDGEDLYPTVYDKAAILFYVLIKNHPLKNGNKRMAYTALSYFLNKHKIDLDLTNDEVYKFTKKVASSDASRKDAIISYIKKTIK